MTLRKSTALLAGAAALVVTALALAGCGGGSDTDATPTTASGSAGDDRGGQRGPRQDPRRRARSHALPVPEGLRTKSTCFGKCAANWPPLDVSGKPTEGSGANAELVGTTSRPGGKSQVTYNGHPLYLFAGDKNPGDTNGEGVNAFGGSWYALSPAGDQVTPPANGGGGGYGY